MSEHCSRHCVDAKNMFYKIFNIDQQDIYGYWWIWMVDSGLNPKRAKPQFWTYWGIRIPILFRPKYPARYCQKFKILGVKNSTLWKGCWGWWGHHWWRISGEIISLGMEHHTVQYTSHCAARKFEQYQTGVTFSPPLTK